MVETVVSMGLPVDERLEIKKNRLMPEETSDNMKRIGIVTGTHGDELEGQFVCYELNQRIQKHPEYLHGIVDIYPAFNPLGIDSITRGIPMFDLDMNRIFPGSEEGPMMETMVSRLMSDLKGADMCIDIHASNIYLEEMPQVRINEETADQLVPYARLLNVDFVWIHAAATVLESTLAYSLNMIDVPTLVVEMGVGMRITKDYGYQLVDGILNLMKEMGIWSGPVESVREPLISSDRAIGFVNADHPGIYLPDARIFDEVMRGDVLGKIVDPLTGSVLEEVKAPITGKVFTRREYPIVYSGSLLNRILGGAEE
ncbi:M14 family metallopeptidase [Blautia obeum]|uniref:M14 family metallopeptidase n=1 Tax=Blautia obeum TaxID=40520 RepID=UPI00306F2988|nr:M14 family metallopeptidase [Lachnospiraceae bacterium]MCI6534475.1 M14 family metallopeptidase [Lachnospiraceae bacterium]